MRREKYRELILMAITLEELLCQIARDAVRAKAEVKRESAEFFKSLYQTEESDPITIPED